MDRQNRGELTRLRVGGSLRSTLSSSTETTGGAQADVCGARSAYFWLKIEMLDERLLADAKGADSLPLLQFTLRQL